MSVSENDRDSSREAQKGGAGGGVMVPVLHAPALTAAMLGKRENSARGLWLSFRQLAVLRAVVRGANNANVWTAQLWLARLDADRWVQRAFFSCFSTVMMRGTVDISTKEGAELCTRQCTRNFN